jgi:hypothetical protein
MQGQTLSASAGTWSGMQTGYSYKWEACDTSGANCTAIAGASSYTLSGAPATTNYKLSSANVGHTLRVVVTATNSAGSAAATSAPTATVTPLPPANTVAPGIKGILIQGQTLTASTGTWTGKPTGYGYQWNDCDSAGANCIPINGATASTYTLTAAEVSHTITVLVTATNAGGAGTATSAPTKVIKPPAPTNTVLPAITGTTTQGQTLTASTGTWTGSPTSYRYQWYDCDSAGANCTPITGATAATHALTATDVGHTITVRVTAVNATGSGTATSGPTTIVTSSAGQARASGEQTRTVTCVAVPPSSGLWCSGRASGTLRLKPSPRAAWATISRGHVIYGSGLLTGFRTHRRSRLVLVELRPLRPGAYTLTLRWPHQRRTARIRVRIALI